MYDEYYGELRASILKLWDLDRKLLQVTKVPHLSLNECRSAARGADGLSRDFSFGPAGIMQPAFRKSVAYWRIWFFCLELSVNSA